MPRRTVEVLADLMLTVEGEDIAIRGEGKRIVIDLPSLGAGRKLLYAGPFTQAQRTASTTRAHEVLTKQGLALEVRYQGDVVARLGAGARPSAIARVLNLGTVEVRPAQPVVTAARRRPGLTLGIGALLAVLVGFFLFRRSGDDE
jgi:hypothetical protein